MTTATTIHTPTGPINVRRYASIPPDFFVEVRFNESAAVGLRPNVTSITRRLPSEIRRRSDVTKDVVQEAVDRVIDEFERRLTTPTHGWSVRTIRVREESPVWGTPPVRGAGVVGAVDPVLSGDR